MRNHRWKIANPDPDLAAAFVRDLSIPSLLARGLVNRGCKCVTTATNFLEPRLARLRDPFLVPNMEHAVERLLHAHARQESLVIFGDYDVDGVTSTALLTEFFKEMGWNSSYYLPHRLEEGYGLSVEAVQKCLERFETKLLLAVDCGSTATEVIASLCQKGVDVIVLDHHQVSDPPPAAFAIVNPQLGGAAEERSLCSAGLAFKLAHALLKRCRTLDWPHAHTLDLRRFLDLVALGTIADMVPLTAENRIFACGGLNRLQRSERPGLAALKKAAGLNASIGCQEVAFHIAPRLNASGRLETALDALELLLTTAPKRAEQLAGLLDRQNRDRQALEKKIVEQAIAAVQARFNPQADFAIVAGHAEWHLGVIGIVASRVLREFHRPVVIFGSDGTDFWRGSGRSIKGFDLAAGLRSCADLLVKSGGHAMAAGVTIASGKLDEFRERLNRIVAQSLRVENLEPELELDGEVTLAELTFPSLHALERVEPFGVGNPPLQFVSRRLTMRGEARALGAEGQHRRFDVTDGTATHQAIWWNCANSALPDTFDLAFAPELNEFNGTCRIQLKVLDLKASV